VRSTEHTRPALDFPEEKSVDEADGATVLVSEWLELDADDDWVRDDYEIVSVSRVEPLHQGSAQDPIL
jgi:hypothetical protein